ncbi:hypothetical protein Tco_1103077 [Tanacetum coccineum]
MALVSSVSHGDRARRISDHIFYWMILSPSTNKFKWKCSCSCVDGILVDGASWSIDIDTGESAKSTALGTAIPMIFVWWSTRVNQRHEDMINLTSCHAAAHMEFCCSEDGLGNDFGYNKLYELLRPIEIIDLLKISTLFEKLPLESDFVFRQRRSVEECEE